MRMPTVVYAPIFAVCATILIVALPVIIPLAFAWHGIQRFRLRATAKRFACTSCGRLLGIEALAIADELWRAHVAEIHRNNPKGTRLRLVRSCDAICPECETKFRFHGGTFSSTSTL